MGRCNLKLTTVKTVVTCGMKSKLMMVTSAIVRKSIMDPLLLTI